MIAQISHKYGEKIWTNPLQIVNKNHKLLILSVLLA